MCSLPPTWDGRPVASPVPRELVMAAAGGSGASQRTEAEPSGRSGKSGLGRGSPQLGQWGSESFRSSVNWGSPEAKAAFSGTHFGEDGIKKMRPKERVRTPDPHNPVRADGPNSIWSSGDPTHLDWSGQRWGGLELGWWTGITKGRTASLWGSCKGAREQVIPL